MNNFTYQIPTRFVFGRGAENQVGAEVRAQGGTKVLIHYGGGSAVRSGLIDRVKKSLDEANIQHFELGGVQPEAVGIRFAGFRNDDLRNAAAEPVRSVGDERCERAQGGHVRDGSIGNRVERVSGYGDSERGAGAAGHVAV